jgi:hypothetical protein
MTAQKPPISYQVKKIVVETSLLALAAAFEIVSKHAPEMKAELADWEDSRIFSLGVLPNGPAISLQKKGSEIHYLGKGYHNPQLKILFKNLDSAILPFTGQIGSHIAFVQRRAILQGNVGEAMQISRAMAIVQSYLMPGLVFDKIFKRPPKLTPAQLFLKARVMAMLGPSIFMKVWK